MHQLLSRVAMGFMGCVSTYVYIVIAVIVCGCGQKSGEKPTLSKEAKAVIRARKDPLPVHASDAWWLTKDINERHAISRLVGQELNEDPKVLITDLRNNSYVKYRRQDANDSAIVMPWAVRPARATTRIPSQQ